MCSRRGGCAEAAPVRKCPTPLEKPYPHGGRMECAVSMAQGIKYALLVMDTGELSADGCCWWDVSVTVRSGCYFSFSKTRLKFSFFLITVGIQFHINFNKRHPLLEWGACRIATQLQTQRSASEKSSINPRLSLIGCRQSIKIIIIIVNVELTLNPTSSPIQ